MKHQAIAFIFFTVIIIGLWKINDASAYVSGPLNSWGTVIVGREHSNQSKFYIGFASSSSMTLNWSTGFGHFTNSLSIVTNYDGGPTKVYSSLSEAAAAARSFISSGQNVYTSGANVYFDQVVVIKGNVRTSGSVPSGCFYGSYDEFEDATTPSWWDRFGNWWNDVYKDIFGHDIPENDVWWWMFDQFDDDTGLSNIDIIAPTFVPTPTAIPYQTVIVPVRDPNTGDVISYNYEYHYTNPSGTPIAATAPPEQPERQPTGSGSSDDYHPQDPLAIPSGIDWINPGFKAGAYQDEFSNPLGALSDGLDMISFNFSSASGEYTQGVSGVSQSFQFIPSSWFMLIGMGAAIIILAGIINRFLG